MNRDTYKRGSMDTLKINEFAAVLVVAIALLGQVNGQVYQTNDAIVFDFDRKLDGAFPVKSFPFQSDFVPIKNFLTGGFIPHWRNPFDEPTPSDLDWHNIDANGWLQHPLAYRPPIIPSALNFRSGKALQQRNSKQNKARCGAGPDQNRIVNGEEAKPNSWPFMAAFMRPGSGFVNCGGSLISDTKILTAAHCFEGKSMYDISRMVVKLGMHDRGTENKNDDAQVTRRISRMTLHKAYNAKTNRFDVAIITMDSAVAFSKAISPVCLAPASSNVDIYAGQNATVMGWGLLKASALGGVDSQKLMQTKVPIITNAACKKIFPEPPDRIVNHMLCASGYPNSSCNGDSGGPLVLKSKDGLWTQVGIVSWGHALCAFQVFPAAVYTKVSWLWGWINEHM